MELDYEVKHANLLKYCVLSCAFFSSLLIFYEREGHEREGATRERSTRIRGAERLRAGEYAGEVVSEREEEGEEEGGRERGREGKRSVN